MQINPRILLEYCETEIQTRNVDALIHYGNTKRAAKALNIDSSTLRESLKKLEKKASLNAVAPHRDVEHQTMEGFSAKFVTSRYDKDGNLAGQYVRQERDKDSALEERLQDFTNGLIDSVKNVYKPVTAPTTSVKDRLNVYAIGDHHLGMYSYKTETGHNYDVEIAENLLEQSFESLIARSPDSESGMFLNMGDFMHTDSVSGLTTAGTPQDTDGRYGRTIEHAAKLMHRMITRLLEKHLHVYVINVQGNHDKNASLFMNQIMMAYFHNEPRITVLCNQKKFIPFVWGKTFILTHHGDGINAAKMYEVATRDYREEWGSCPFVYGYTAHLHHKTVEERGGMIMEQWGVLCATDAYHAGKGYGAGRTMTCVTHHKEYGELERQTFKAEMAGY
tara:strand:+ start:45 stop:1217 length:1173 start_codon:yes stop_codon:yes gene_type:complete